MTSGSKRKLDGQWERPTVSKSPRLLHSDASPFASKNRTIANTPQPSYERATAWDLEQDSRSRIPPEERSSTFSNVQPLLSSGPSRPEISTAPSISIYKPIILHPPHPDSNLCQNFHWVPYPLGLMAYDSWHNLHHRDSDPSHPFRCPVCRQERKVTPHARKVFLVAERLTWDDKLVSIHEKNLNEELNWKVNYELGILDPFVEDEEQVIGGKHSRINRFYPYQNEHEMKLALKLIFMTEDITETTWSLWISTQQYLHKMLDDGQETKSVVNTKNACLDPKKPVEAVETIDLTGSPEPPSTPVSRRSFILPTRPSPSKSTTRNAAALGMPRGENHQHPKSISSEPVPVSHVKTLPPKKIQSYKSLQDFYSLLDRIERTSYVGATFLEAYAEKLRDDMCKNCWLKHNVIPSFD